MGRSPVLSVEGLEKAFGRSRVLEGVDLAVDEGAFAVLLGPPGAGKSTLVGAVAGLVATDRGRLTLRGHDLERRRSSVASNIGIVFADGVLDPDRTIVADLLYHAALHGIGRRQAKAAIDAELDRLGLRSHRNDPVKVLGATNRRRMELVRALLHAPVLLLVDEGAAGLDAEGRRSVLADARAAAGRGTAVLWATDRADDVSEGDRLAVIDHGRIVFTGNPADFIAERNADSLDAAYRAAVSRVDEGGPRA